MPYYWYVARHDELMVDLDHRNMSKVNKGLAPRLDRSDLEICKDGISTTLSEFNYDQEYIDKSTTVIEKIKAIQGQMFEPAHSYIAWKLRGARARLLGAIKEGKLNVKDVWLYPSGKEWHYHLIVRLDNPMNAQMKIMWQARLYDDAHRVISNLYRYDNMVDAHTLLITDQTYQDFYRLPDEVCTCKAKHSPEVMEVCPVAIKLRGDYRNVDPWGKAIPASSPFTFGKMELY